MANEEDTGIFLNLSKKELQCLCKKYGLSPYKTKPNLAKSLVSYLQKKNVSSLTSCERLTGAESALLPSSLVPQLPPGSQLNSLVDCGKASYGIISHSGEKVKEAKHLQAIKCNKPWSNAGAGTNDKALCNDIPGYSGCRVHNFRETSHMPYTFRYDGSNYNYELEPPNLNFDKSELAFMREGGSVPQFQSGDANFDGCPTNHSFANPINLSTNCPTSSFEFYVRSDEGIRLYVDLNSSPSDWTDRLKNEVCIAQSMHNNNSCSQEKNHWFCGENNNHLLTSNADSSHEINNGLVLSKSSTSLVVIEDSHPDGDDRCLKSSAIRQCGITVDMTGQLGEDQLVLFSSGSNTVLGKQMLSADEFHPRDERILALDSDASDTPKITSLEFQTKFDNTNFQISEVENSHCEKSTLQIPSSFVNTSMVVPGCLASPSANVRSSEVANPCQDASCSCDDGGFLPIVHRIHDVERGHGKLANSSELKENISFNNLCSSTEVSARSNLIDRSVDSECSLFDNSIEKVSLRSDGSESSEGLKKKRKGNDCEYNNDFGKPDANAKKFKYVKHRSAEVPRRSQRLVSK